MPKLKHPDTGKIVTVTHAGAEVLRRRGYTDPDALTGQASGQIERPAEYASRTAWDTYALSRGVDPADYSSKFALIEAIG